MSLFTPKVEKIDRNIEMLEAEIAKLDDDIQKYKELEKRKEISKAEYNSHKARLTSDIRAKRARIKHKMNIRMALEKKLKEKEEKKRKKLEEKIKKEEERRKKLKHKK